MCVCAYFTRAGHLLSRKLISSSFVKISGSNRLLRTGNSSHQKTKEASYVLNSPNCTVFLLYLKFCETCNCRLLCAFLSACFNNIHELSDLCEATVI